MATCSKNTLKCLLDGLGVFISIPTTTTTTIDPICYLVDCKGNYIVDCECDYIVGCGCEVTTTSSTTTAYSPSTTSTTTTAHSGTTTTTTSTSSTTTTSVPATTSTTTTSGGGTTTTTTTVSPTEPLVVPEGANLISFGDSITTDNYVGNPAFLYTTLLAGDLGITSARYAQGSTGFKSLMRFVHQGCNGVSCETLNSQMTPNTNVATELYGLNDVYYEANRTNNLNIVRHGCLTLMSIQWAASITNGANASISRTGTFIGYTANNNYVCGRYGTSAGGSLPNTTDAIYSNTPGSYVEYTATFKHAIIGLVGGGGEYSSIVGIPIPSGVVNIYVDSVLQTTIDLGDQYPVSQPGVGSGFGGDIQTVGPVMVPLIMPSSASRTIKIELASGDMAIDYISVLDSPSVCYPVILGEIPYVNPSVGDGWGPNGGSQAVADTYSGEKLTLVNTWAAQGFPIRYCDTNTYYSYINTTDGTHPNVLGNQQVKDAFRALFV